MPCNRTVLASAEGLSDSFIINGIHPDVVVLLAPENCIRLEALRHP